MYTLGTLKGGIINSASNGLCGGQAVIEVLLENGEIVIVTAVPGNKFRVGKVKKETEKME